MKFILPKLYYNGEATRLVCFSFRLPHFYTIDSRRSWIFLWKNVDGPERSGRTAIEHLLFSLELVPFVAT